MDKRALRMYMLFDYFPTVAVTAHNGLGIPFNRIVEIGKFERVFQEKYGAVIANKGINLP